MVFLEPIQALRSRKTMTRTLRNFDSAGEDQLSSMIQRANLDENDESNLDPPARERPAVSTKTF